MAGRREAGELNEGHKFTGAIQNTAPANPTLESEGINTNLAARARKLAPTWPGSRRWMLSVLA